MNHTKKSLEATPNMFKSPTDDFEYLNFLGKGAYGKVFQVRKLHGKDENQIYAMKSMCKYFIMNKTYKSYAHAVSEFNILKSIKHSFLVELMYVFQEKTKIHFVLEYLSGGTLDALLKKRFLLLEPAASFYMKEIILAIEYLHSENIIHRDLKPQNVLLDSTGHVKLSDFGLSKEGIHDDRLTRTVCGSPAYMAPEIQSKRGYGKAVDWWALGILFYRLLVGYRPFISSNPEELKLMISKGIFNIPKRLSILAQDLISQLIQIDPIERLGSYGAHEIKNHNFFADTLWDRVFQRLETPPFIPKAWNTVNIETTNTPIEDIPDAATKDAEDEKNNNLFKNFHFINSKLIENPEKPDDSTIKNLTTSIGNLEISKSDSQ